MKPFHFIALIIFIALPNGIGTQIDAQENTPDKNEKLDVQFETKESSLVSLDGHVKSRGKYSFEIDTGGSTHAVKLTKSTEIRLKVTSPRIDLDEKQLIIDVEGAEKRYRGYPVPSPLFVRINFVHRKQIKRVADQPVKRLSDFELLATKPVVMNRNLSWVGELKKGVSNRQLKLVLDGKEYDVLLGKRGSMTGFSITDLKAGLTGVRISGELGENGVIEATTILFWPSASYKKEAKGEK